MTKNISKVEDALAFMLLALSLLPVAVSMMAIVWGMGSSPLIFILVLIQSAVFLGVYIWFRDLVLPFS